LGFVDSFDGLEKRVLGTIHGGTNAQETLGILAHIAAGKQ
jgi:hypothetical protein